MSTAAPRPRPLYDAFISYSWAKDKPLVARLRKVLQTLGKPWWQRRSLRIFVDETSLSATPQLWPSIERAMAQSRYMILFASPEAARSRWVDMEVGTWLRTKPANTVLIALSGGELLWDQATSDFRRDENTPLPPSLRGAFATEPKWVDLRAFREAGNVKSDDRFLAASADFAAIIAGIPKEDLLSEEVRQQRRAVRLAYGAATMLGLLALVAAGLGLIAKQQSDIATENYLTARGTVDRIISSFAGRLSQMQGLTIDTVETAFKEIRRSVDELGMRAAASDPTFDKTRADLAYEFARTYKKVESPRAPLLVEESLRLLEGLAARDAKNRDYTLAISNSHELMSDLMRTSSPKQAWQANEKALALRRQLNTEQPKSSTWAESLSKSLIRAGDLEAQVNRDFATASKRYYEALDLSLSWWLQTEDDSSWQRELSWALSKIGDQKSRGSASSQSRHLLTLSRSCACAAGSTSFIAQIPCTKATCRGRLSGSVAPASVSAICLVQTRHSWSRSCCAERYSSATATTRSGYATCT
jgi:hypothetical protein